jgi:hypothetical protein
MFATAKGAHGKPLHIRQMQKWGFTKAKPAQKASNMGNG